MEQVLINYLKKNMNNFTSNIKSSLLFFFKKVYIYLFLSIINSILFCLSFFSLIVKIANELDKNGIFLWKNSMTVYSIVSAMSLGILIYLLNIKKPKLENNNELNSKINKFIKN